MAVAEIETIVKSRGQSVSVDPHARQLAEQLAENTRAYLSRSSWHS